MQANFFSRNLVFLMLIHLITWPYINCHNTTTESKFEPRVVGGDPIPIESRPWHALFFNLGAMCSATILNSWALITAAHCFDHSKDIDEMTVHVGSRYLFDTDTETHYLNNFVIHENYNKSRIFACDIAMIFVEDAINFREKVKKAVLIDSDKWMFPNESDFLVEGWGRTKYKGPLSTKGLMMARLRFVPSDDCGRLHSIKLAPEMFCLYGDGKRDSCMGDSGGGVTWNQMLVGVISHGEECAKKDKPSIYTNIWHMRKWIESTFMRHVKANCKTVP